MSGRPDTGDDAERVTALSHAWIESVRERHTRALTFPEIRRALQALSSLYVERRGGRLAGGAALDGAGKRAAFALYYAPLHFALVHRIARELRGPAPERILDLGCGTGAAGAGWALACDSPPPLAGTDRDPRVLDEARATWGALGLQGRAEKGDAARALPPASRSSPARGKRSGRPGLLAAFLANELAPEARERLLEDLLAAASGGAQVLVVEPISRRLTPWWAAWSGRFRAAGGRDDDWKFEPPLPPVTLELGRAAGLHPLPVTGRSLSAGFQDGHSGG